MLLLGDLSCVSLYFLGCGENWGSARHGAEAEAIATSVLEGLTCRGLEFGCHSTWSYLEP